MPMTWDAAADAKLFTVVMAVYDIKISGAQNEKIAKLMGDDVTPKAITHRLSKIKAQASSFDPSTPSTSSRKRGTPSSKSTSTKTPITTKGKGSNGKTLSATHTITTIMHDNGSNDEEDFDTPIKAANFKKRKLGGKGPKIEDADAMGFFPGMGGDDDDGNGDGDAIDFSVGYSGKTDIKAEDNSHGGTVDLIEDAEGGAGKEAKGEGKQKEIAAIKIKKEVIDVVDMVSADSNEDDDEMAI